MKICVHHWDAFTHQPGKGNPAGIVLSSQDLADRHMQAIAKAIDFNDTAFVLPSDKAALRIRYFAPNREVELCGHATVAAFSALYQQQQLPDSGHERCYTLETKAGVISIELRESSNNFPLIVMNQGKARFANFNGERAALARAIGIDVSDFHPTLPVMYGSTGRWTLLVPVTDLGVMQRMHPITDQFDLAVAEMPNASIHPFCLETISPRAKIHARHFSSPGSGTVEDAVTGTASGVLGAYYQQFIKALDSNEQPLIIEQGYEVGREGTVQVWAAKQGDDHVVKIAGNACFVRDIEIELAQI